MIKITKKYLLVVIILLLLFISACSEKNINEDFVLVHEFISESYSDINEYELYIDQINNKILIKQIKTFIGEFSSYGPYYYEYKIYPSVTKFNSETINWISYSFEFLGSSQLLYDFEDEEWTYTKR
jgi:predicted sugar kinase